MRVPGSQRQPRGLAPHPIAADRDGEQACYGKTTDEFFPTTPHGKPGRRTKEAEAQTEAAKAACRRCPFLDDCLAYAMDRPSIWGIWGGRTKDERAALRKQRRAS